MFNTFIARTETSTQGSVQHRHGTSWGRLSGQPAPHSQTGCFSSLNTSRAPSFLQLEWGSLHRGSGSSWGQLFSPYAQCSAYPGLAHRVLVTGAVGAWTLVVQEAGYASCTWAEKGLAKARYASGLLCFPLRCQWLQARELGFWWELLSLQLDVV